VIDGRSFYFLGFRCINPAKILIGLEEIPLITLNHLGFEIKLTSKGKGASVSLTNGNNNSQRPKILAAIRQRVGVLLGF
jgi:hypothetical protein